MCFVAQPINFSWCIFYSGYLVFVFYTFVTHLSLLPPVDQGTSSSPYSFKNALTDKWGSVRNLVWFLTFLGLGFFYTVFFPHSGPFSQILWSISQTTIYWLCHCRFPFFWQLNSSPLCSDLFSFPWLKLKCTNIRKGHTYMLSVIKDTTKLLRFKQKGFWIQSLPPSLIVCNLCESARK